MSSTPPSGPSEIELKFQLAPESLKRLRDNPIFNASARRRRLNTIYYDTPGHDLREGGMSLRVRESDGRFVQTVKSRQGASLFDRNEWEMDVEDASPNPGGMTDNPVNGLLDEQRQGPLAAVFSTRVDRMEQDLHRSGSVVELSLDQGEIVAGDRREPICELELELKAGDPGALFDLARDLGGEGALRLSFETKSERGYRLAGRDTVKALKAERTQISPDTPAGDAFKRVVRSCLAQITGNAQRLMTVRSPDALHQLRVGLRRLRAAFGVFKPVAGDAGFERLDAETRWLSESLNEARDLDVFLRSIAPASEDDPDDNASMAALRQRLLHRQVKAYDAALAAVASTRFDRLLLELAAWAEAGEWSTSNARRFARARQEPVSALARRSLTHLRKAARKAGGDMASLDPPHRHKARIKVKKLRYAADFFAQAVANPQAKRMAQFMETLRGLQDCLGELNDIDVARQTAWAAVEEPGGAGAGFAAGLVIGRREGQEPALLASAVEAFERFDKAKRFW